MHKEAYILGARLALKHAGLDETGEAGTLPAEALAALLHLQEDVARGAPTGQTHKKDPKDPRDDAIWSTSGPFSGDNLTRYGLSPEISAQYGGI